MNNDLQLIQGLSKRERSKIERLIKNDQVHKNQNHAKSYKRKAGKGKNAEQNGPRKLFNSEANGGFDQSQSISSSYSQKMKDQNQELTNKKGKKLRDMRPFNPNFPVQGGQQGLFSYIMVYSYSQKQKKAEQNIKDVSFLQTCEEGIPLQLIDNSNTMKRNNKILQQFQIIKQKIQCPFDEIHKQFTRKINSPQFLKTIQK